MSEIYGRLTGRKRIVIIISGAASGLGVVLLFAAFARGPIAPLELISGAIVGGLLGLSASLGEARHRRPDQ